MNTSTELWQLYNEQGNPLSGQGASKQDVFAQGLLHGAAHVWMWRNNNGTTEVLLQKRSATKTTWPNCLDISAAGHIDLDEQPLQAAVRETREEIGLQIDPAELSLIAVLRAYMTTPAGPIENEFAWLYSLELAADTNFELQQIEVDSLVWMPLETFAAECGSDTFVPHSQDYYNHVITAMQQSAGRL